MTSPYNNSDCEMQILHIMETCPAVQRLLNTVQLQFPLEIPPTYSNLLEFR